jgi:hypothetical protein
VCAALKKLKNLDYSGVFPSPLVHLRLKKSTGDRTKDEQLLQDIVDTVRVKNKMILVRAKYVQHEKFMPSPSIRFVISAHHSKSEIESAIAAVDAAAQNVK